MPLPCRNAPVAVRRAATATALGATALGATALGATALGATALGATALGATALGATARARALGRRRPRSGRHGRRLPAFAVAAGGMVCASCRPPGAASPAAPTVALMLALLRGEWDSAERSERRHRVECSGLVAAYLQWHLEHSIRSLRHVERV